MDNYFKDFKTYMHFNPRIRSLNSGQYWEDIKLRKSPNVKGVQQPFCDVNEQVDPDFVESFGTKRPGPARYLLHRAPGWDSAPHTIPLLLIHGAGLDASSYTSLYGMGHTGLQQHLVELGHRVFALTFPHSHGDNCSQGEIIADAIDAICTETGKPQLDILAHSKGGIAARVYMSNLAKTHYRGDVRRFVSIGVPHLGTDWAFRNPSTAFLIYLAAGNGVIAWDKLIYFGGIIDISNRSIYQDGCFPGQSQILHTWDDVYVLDPTQQDWWTTYYGGMGYFSHSRGINQAIHDGGNLIKALEKKGLEPDIEVAVLAGDNHFFDVVPGESTGPSDGIVFVDSALNTDAMLIHGAKLISKTILPYNHMEILWKRRVADWIHHVLTE